MSDRAVNHDQVVVHEYLHRGGWCDCGDGPFTRDEWLVHRGPLPEMPPVPEPVYESLPNGPVVSEAIYEYLTKFWPDEAEGAMTLRARAASIEHRIREALA